MMLYILKSQIPSDRECYNRLDRSAVYRQGPQYTRATITVACFCLLVEFGTLTDFRNKPIS
jgi:hypothetical protein